MTQEQKRRIVQAVTKKHTREDEDQDELSVTGYMAEMADSLDEKAENESSKVTRDRMLKAAKIIRSAALIFAEGGLEALASKH